MSDTNEPILDEVLAELDKAVADAKAGKEPGPMSPRLATIHGVVSQIYGHDVSLLELDEFVRDARRPNRYLDDLTWVDSPEQHTFRVRTKLPPLHRGVR